MQKHPSGYRNTKHFVVHLGGRIFDTRRHGVLTPVSSTDELMCARALSS